MKKSKSRALIIALAAVLCVALAAAALYLIFLPKSAPADYLSAHLEELRAAAVANLPDDALRRAAGEALSYELDGEAEQQYRRASASVTVSYLDTAALTDGLEEEMQPILAQRVSDALRPAEVYGEDDTFLPELVDAAYEEAVDARLSNAADYMESESAQLSLSYEDGSWRVSEGESELERLFSVDSGEAPGEEAATEKLEYVDFHYTLPDWTSPGPEPDETLFGETDDPAVITALLETETAQKLINGQTLDWSADKELIPGSTIHYYLDETILALVWQESEHGAIGTFSEVFIADASQLRRKIADDTFGCQSYYYPTQLAEQANAVVAVSGDFYDHPDRVYGVYAYNGQVMLSNLSSGQTCYFTDSGDMIFSYEGQFADEAEAQAFLDENHVMFSLSFGPVMIENGVDVTPYNYPLGEVLDTYARCAIGQLGERHYLAMTINVRVPDYNVYVTLRQAADSMIAHGCEQAYTLDGGQTGSIIIGGELINPVQFGTERLMSDIFYFATAIPDD